MGLFGDKISMPTREQALPGRSDPIVVAEKHIVLGSRMRAPFPDGMKLAKVVANGSKLQYREASRQGNSPGRQHLV